MNIFRLSQYNSPLYHEALTKQTQQTTQTEYFGDNMDVLTSALNQVWFCFNVIFITFVLSTMASRISALIYGENWVTLPGESREQGQHQISSKSTLDHIQRADQAESGTVVNKSSPLITTKILSKLSRRLTRAKVDQINHVEWREVCLWWLWYHGIFCLMLDDWLSCGTSVPGLILGFLPLLIPFRFYNYNLRLVMVLYAGWLFGCVYWGHAWLAAFLKAT